MIREGNIGRGRLLKHYRQLFPADLELSESEQNEEKGLTKPTNM